MALAPSRLLFLVPSSCDQRAVDAALVLRVHAGERVEDLAVDGVDRLASRPCRGSGLVAVAQLDRLVRAGRGARRHGGAAHGAVLEHTSTSTVGLPRLSRISRPMMSMIAVIRRFLVSRRLSSGFGRCRGGGGCVSVVLAANRRQWPALCPDFGHQSAMS